MKLTLVLFVSIISLSYQDLGWFGCPGITAPGVDLAAFHNTEYYEVMTTYWTPSRVHYCARFLFSHTSPSELTLHYTWEKTGRRQRVIGPGQILCNSQNVSAPCRFNFKGLSLVNSEVRFLEYTPTYTILSICYSFRNIFHF